MNEELIEKIGARMISNYWTLAVAESVTAGNLQAAFSLAENARQFFQGGITAYNLGQKARLLKVEPIHAQSCNSVSETVAQQMAIHSSRLFTSSWGIGITGYAAPVPESGIFKIYANVAFSQDRRIVQCNRICSGEWSPLLAQQDYVHQVLLLFDKLLSRILLSRLGESRQARQLTNDRKQLVQHNG